MLRRARGRGPTRAGGAVDGADGSWGRAYGQLVIGGLIGGSVSVWIAVYRYHHLTVLVMGWYAYACANPSSIMFATINYGVHSVWLCPPLPVQPQGCG